jgi:GDYXXLXY protein
MTLAALRRVPHWLPFALAGLIQVALIAFMVWQRVQILRDGTEVMLQARPVDPRDFLRGDYVALSYDISTVPAGPLAGEPGAHLGMPVFVTLAPGADGYYGAVALHRERVAVSGPQVLIAGRIRGGADCGGVGHEFCASVPVTYGIESYFVPQGEGLAIEQARSQGKVAIVAAVTADGRAAIKRLLLDGKPVYDEPWF